ncbi:MAG: lipid A biosynthesis lauroyl acyltransferase, partial [Betaproteobacteria bacterium]|nr:lipid A biosynthesis lauroyl acyltransferase [Betaproteobacteria bacterium]
MAGQCSIGAGRAFSAACARSEWFLAIRLAPLFSVERLRPRYWAAWMSLLSLRLLAMLPYGALLPLGRLIGLALYYASPGRREIARINLRLCFPDKPDAERERLLRENFASLGMAVCE